MATDHELLLQVKERQESLQRQIQEVRDLKASPTPSGAVPSNTGNSTITLNIAGGWTAVACAALAAVCFYIAADARGDAAELRAEARDLGRKVERREDYLNMLWQKYPELRPDKLKQEKPSK